MRKFLISCIMILVVTIFIGCNNNSSSNDSSMPHPKNADKKISPPLPPSI